jgi:hypothetical protein
MNGKGDRNRPLWFEIFAVLLTPLAIASASYWVTLTVNKQQQENAKLIADAQAANSARIADAQVSVAKLNQIKDLFKQIFIDNPEIPKDEVILSLSAYGPTALPFVLRALEYGKAQENKKLIETSEKAIATILASSQLNLTHLHMTNQSLRAGNFYNLNLREADFSGSNLYMANMRRCDLTEANFRNTDLFLADFRNANLTRAEFTKSNVRRASFLDAKLDGANFKDAYHVEDAKFTISSLKDPVFSKNDMIKLMQKYKVEIERDQFGEGLLKILSEKYHLQPADLRQ